MGTPLRVTLRTVATATLIPVAYGGKPAYSAGFTATHWLLCVLYGSFCITCA
ncbi:MULTISPECIES: hypothetical protein [unclassified Nostoc]|uniref:hypothetical protein n=1 Tax=unclassified Nostoc TaxID=2593658 RepID=UPI002601D140|nr:hypothetical protein [Nostoc sp. S13]MDF5736203.1 hypothetical protein [Nostoc sp. S13]